MLAYAFHSLKGNGYTDLSYEEFKNVQDLYAAILAKGIHNQVRRGINKDYISRIDTQNTLRGKSNISDIIKMMTQRSNRVVCNFDEFSENTYINQILKSTTKYLSKLDEVKPDRKKSLKRILVYFNCVDDIEFTSIKWNLVRYRKNDGTNRMLLNLCYLSSQEQILNEEIGNRKVFNIFDDQRMHRLFERFVLEYYRKHFPQFKPRSTYISWKVDDGCTDFLPLMKTDILISHKDYSLIIDTKYYTRMLQENVLFNRKTFHSSNLYQIFTYVKNMDPLRLGKVTGMLLYAKTEDEQVQKKFYKLNGNDIVVNAIDLDKKFSDICNALDSIIYDWIDSSNCNAEKSRYS